MDVDETLAVQWLANVSYYRLSAYWYPAWELDAHGNRTDRFVPGTTFGSAIELYEADRKLRTLLHDGIERIEITMRTRIGELLCNPGPLTYADPSRFRPTFNHPRWIETAQKRITRAENNNEAIKHYRKEYEGNFPFWVLAEVLDFSDISRLYQGLRSQDQRIIAEGLGFSFRMEDLSKNQQQKTKKQSPLARWLEQLTIIRNTCAHHGRLWNKSFTPAPATALRTRSELAALPEGQSERIFGALLIMAHFLRTTSPGTTWPVKVTRLINESFVPNPLVSYVSLGLSSPDAAVLLSPSSANSGEQHMSCQRT